MSSFTDPLILEQLPDGEHWRTTRHLEYHAGAEDSQEVYTVPEGFVTDGASIPQFAWGIVGHPLGLYAAAAVLHDWLYRTAPVCRLRADELLLEAMAVLGVGWIRRRTIYRAVRWFGGWAWEANRKLEEASCSTNS